MNAAQARSIARLIEAAEHPRMDLITGQPYEDDEYLAYGRAWVSTGEWVGSREAPHGHGELLAFTLHVAGIGAQTHEVYVSESGGRLLWSTVRIPPEDCDCECAGPIVTSLVDAHDAAIARAAREVDDRKRRDCPRHGQAVRELDCWRPLRHAGWVIGWHASVGTPGVDLPHWKFAVAEGDPLDDPLARHRQARTVKP
jgi:hypothetical protein